MPDRVDTPSVNVADRHATGDLSDKQTADAARPPTQAVAESDPEAEQLGPLTDLWVDDDPTPSPSGSELELLTIPPISASHYIGDVEFNGM